VSGEREASREHARHLMMAALDGELGPDERGELDRLLAADDALRVEWERMSRVKEVTGSMAYRKLPDEVWDRYWETVYNKAERGVGWVLLSIGSLVLFGYGTWKWLEAVFAETDLPFMIKISLFAVLLGGFVLLFSVIREKWFTRKRDPYKEVQR